MSITSPPERMTSFLVLWSGQALSLLGSMAVQFALIWWLTEETGSAAVLATAALVGLLPTVVLGPLVGVLVDRWDRKRIMLAADSVVALASLALAGCYVAQAASPAVVFLVLLVRGLGGAFHAPAMLATTSLMVPERHLGRIQGLNQMLQGGLAIVGAPLGALLLAWLPMSGVMLVDVATALLAIGPLVFIRIPRPPRTDPPPSGMTGSLWRELRAGAGYLVQRRGHLCLVVLSALINLFFVPAFSLLPLLVSGELGGDAPLLGWITSAFGVGTIAGGIVLGTWGGTRRRLMTSLPALLVLGAAVLGLGVAPSSSAAVAAMLMVGAVVPLVNGPIVALFQSTIPADYQGRVFTLMTSLAGAAAPLGLLLAAPVAELAGVRAWFVAGGIVCFAMGAIGLALPSLRRIEDPMPTGDSPPTASGSTALG